MKVTAWQRGDEGSQFGREVDVDADRDAVRKACGAVSAACAVCSARWSQAGALSRARLPGDARLEESSTGAHQRIAWHRRLADGSIRECRGLLADVRPGGP